MKHRRRVPRQSASWEGNCHIQGEFPTRACRVIDISMLGLGMTLEHSSPSELLGRRISVEVPALGDSVTIRLEGVVNNAVSTREGVVRVGIAFDGLSESEPGTAAVHSKTKTGPSAAGVRSARDRNPKAELSG
jgi:hypothetical protein